MPQTWLERLRTTSRAVICKSKQAHVLVLAFSSAHEEPQWMFSGFTGGCIPTYLTYDFSICFWARLFMPPRRWVGSYVIGNKRRPTNEFGPQRVLLSQPRFVDGKAKSDVGREVLRKKLMWIPCRPKPDMGFRSLDTFLEAEYIWIVLREHARLAEGFV